MHDPRTSFSENLLKRITAAGLRPIPKQYFSLKNIALWVLALASVLVGGLAIASSIFRFVNLPQVLPPGSSLPLPILIKLAPILWIILFSTVLFLAYREVRATRKGYRYAFTTIVLALLLASCVLGITFYATGIGARLDHFAGRHVPFVGKLDEAQRERWMRPEHGFLIGTVMSVDDTEIQVLDPKQNAWTVILEDRDLSVMLAPGARVGIRGMITSTTTRVFNGCDIRSLEFAGERGAPFPDMRKERKPDGARITTCGDVRPPYEQ